jgi:hypothetical protein|tara:strand:+ start:410 stop:727 length:318 start_codon:yes stop_codon:yes gene_type:complete
MQSISSYPSVRAKHATAVHRVLLASLGILVAACGDPDPDKQGAGTFERLPVRVQLTAGSVRPISQQLEAIGTTFANESVVITAQALKAAGYSASSFSRVSVSPLC